jgi:hypothetical protein
LVISRESARSSRLSRQRQSAAPHRTFAITPLNRPVGLKSRHWFDGIRRQRLII